MRPSANQAVETICEQGENGKTNNPAALTIAA
jgi:hypothetical protein